MWKNRADKNKIIKKRHKEWQKKMQILEHNLKAYKALIKSFKKSNRACIVHPTGLGKSYIAYQLIADNPDSAFLVLTS
ncbi:MAG: DEAD/DEAH box helicase family protein [Holdemanella porci]